MPMFGSIFKISLICFALIFQVSQASPLPVIEDKIKSEAEAVKETAADRRVFKKETKDKSSALSANVHSKRLRRHDANVYCYNDHTSWNAYSNAPIMYLDRQDVKCVHPYFLTRVHLTRRADRNDADVRYNFQCCKVIV